MILLFIVVFVSMVSMGYAYSQLYKEDTDENKSD